MSLEEGLKALQQQNYPEAVQLLEEYCQQSSNFHAPCYIQAKMSLARAYRGNNQKEKAISLAQELEHHLDAQVSSWAKGLLSILAAEDKATKIVGDAPKIHQKAGRAAQTGVKLAMSNLVGNLKLASGVTILLLVGMVLAVCFALMLIVYSRHPLQGLIISLVLTLIFNGAVFFISPWLMDLTQQWLYKTRWVTLAEIKRNSPEAATIIQRICREKRLNPPKLGIIDDQNPTAFTYGSLPGNARLVVSQGLFTYLDDEEVATVYAHELGHIVHWDFALMTVAACLVQMTYLLYIFARNLGRGSDNESQVGQAAGVAAATAYIFYIIGTYLTLYLSRTREYFADHFAAEATGNPNGLSRALVKIAYGILEEKQNSPESNRLLEGTRALGIYDPKSAVSTGTAYRMATDSRKLGQVFLWDLFNPWGGWLELNSTHPLTGKRIRVLTTYAEQMGLDTEFNMADVVREGNKLNKSQLYRTFFLDICLFKAEWVGAIAGFILGWFWVAKSANLLAIISAILIGFGVGILLKTLVMYPSLRQTTSSDIFSLMCDPYASPLRGRPVQLEGKLIGRGEAGYQFSSELMLQDQTGMIFAHYASLFGSVGNFLFGWSKVPTLIGENVQVVGWFRRGVAPWLDWKQMTHPTITLKSYHRFWTNVMGVGMIIIGIGLMLMGKG